MHQPRGNTFSMEQGSSFSWTHTMIYTGPQQKQLNSGRSMRAYHSTTDPRLQLLICDYHTKNVNSHRHWLDIPMTSFLTSVSRPKLVCNSTVHPPLVNIITHVHSLMDSIVIIIAHSCRSNQTSVHSTK